MEVDNDKIDDAVLALMYLNRFTMHKEDGWRAWKGFDWDTLDRLHERGVISNPASKAKSIVLSDEGYAQSERLFRELFVRREE